MKKEQRRELKSFILSVSSCEAGKKNTVDAG